MKLKKITLIIVIGIIFSFLSCVYIQFIDRLLGINNPSELIASRLYNQDSNGFIYLFIALFLNLGAIINLFILNKDKYRFKRVSSFLKSTIALYVNIYVFIYLLTYLTAYLSFFNPIICFVAYAISMKFIYKLSITNTFLIGGLLLFFVGMIMNYYENFKYLDISWFLCIIILFPLLSETKELKS
ncbi:hypothetical protein [Olleya sp. R77988]|uniref:hypothetical protein n=1 Tax=Olleya sp. R77988 TaxID=3093875 RepID=UPI0037CC7DB9